MSGGPRRNFVCTTPEKVSKISPKYSLFKRKSRKYGVWKCGCIRPRNFQKLSKIVRNFPEFPPGGPPRAPGGFWPPKIEVYKRKNTENWGPKGGPFWPLFPENFRKFPEIVRNCQNLSRGAPPRKKCQKWGVKSTVPGAITTFCGV